MVSPIETVLAALNDAEVRYLVVGGVAVVLHGHLRTTADLDLVVQLRPDNARRAVEALDRLGFRPRPHVRALDFADEAIRRRWILERGLTVLSFWSPKHPGLEVDLFASEPFDFDAVHKRGIRLSLDTTETTIPSIDDLIALKRKVDRPRDREDIAALEALKAQRPTS